MPVAKTHYDAAVKALALRTEDAYSFDRYGKTSWKANIKFLLTKFTLEQTEWIMRSKNARWAADFNETSRHTIPKDTMEKWFKGGNLDNCDEMPGATPVVDAARAMKLARIKVLEAEIVDLRAQIGA